MRIDGKTKQHGRSRGGNRTQDEFANTTGEEELVKSATLRDLHCSSQLPQQTERLGRLHSHLGPSPTDQVLHSLDRAGMGPWAHLAGIGRQGFPLTGPLGRDVDKPIGLEGGRRTRRLPLGAAGHLKAE